MKQCPETYDILLWLAGPLIWSEERRHKVPVYGVLTCSFDQITCPSQVISNDPFLSYGNLKLSIYL